MDMVARAAFITAQAACCNATLIAMQEQNTQDRAVDRPVSFQPHDFEAVPDRFQLGWNSVLTYLQE